MAQSLVRALKSYSRIRPAGVAFPSNFPAFSLKKIGNLASHTIENPCPDLIRELHVSRSVRSH